MPTITSAAALWPNAAQLRGIIGWRPISDGSILSLAAASAEFSGAGDTFPCATATDPVDCPGPGEIPNVSCNPLAATGSLDGRFRVPIVPWSYPAEDTGRPATPLIDVALTDIDPAPDWAYIYVTLGFNYDGYYTGCLIPDFATVGGCDPDTFTLETPTTTLVAAGGGTFEESFDGATHGIGPGGTFDYEGGAVLLPPSPVYVDPFNPLVSWPGWVPTPNVGDDAIWSFADIPSAVTMQINGEFGSWSDGVLAVTVYPLWSTDTLDEVGTITIGATDRGVRLLGGTLR